MGATAETRSASLADRLRNARFEVLPLEGIEEQVLAHLGTDATVTVTASPRRGLEATVELTERLTAAGYATVPHISARLVRDRAHLTELIDRLHAGGVRELFVLAGDAAEPAGEFPGAVELLEAMGPRRADFHAIGITGYPESHHLISDEETIRAMFEKAPMATCIVSQICFDPPRSPPGSQRCAGAAPTCRSGSACRAACPTRSCCGCR
jgi:methylenetetrahydrofolate reductase (NADPH)